MSRHAFRLSRRHRLFLHGSLGTSFASGLAWWLLAHFGQIEGEFGPAPHPAQAWLLRLHGAAAFASLLTLGALLPIHVKRAWRAAKNRRSGTALGSLVALQILTGYALYYAADALRDRAGQVHLALGLGLPVMLALHIVLGRLYARTQPAATSP